MADLVRGSGSELVSKLEPRVTSLAKPSVQNLLQARAEVQRDAAMKQLFRDAKEQGHPTEWLVDQLASRLAGLWDGDLPEALEAARYLADEFTQLGEGILIVSTETGKAIAKLDESDLYTPAPVPRESGNFAEPLPRIEPGMEAMIVSWGLEKGREERVEALLAQRANQTALLREEGDRRLWIATRKGRARMAGALADDHPKTLLERAGGTSGAFLKHFDLALDPPEGAGRTYRLETTMALRVQDTLTSNLQYDRLGSMRGVVAQSWIRELGKQLARDALKGRSAPVWQASNITYEQIQQAETWVASPEVMLRFLDVMFGKVSMGSMVMPVDGSGTLGLKGKVGTIVVPETCHVQNREVFGRWEVHASLDIQVFIDWSKTIPVDVQGLAYEAQVVR
jgi:hypothetical protein